MRIIVISDTHGNYRALESVFLRNKDADWFIHLGDGEKDLDSFIMSHREYTDRIVHVAGNCDSGSLSNDFEVLNFGECRIFATHGHFYNVKQDLEKLKSAARQSGCNVVLYGHTHVRDNKFEDGMYIMNPGSASAPHDEFPPSFGHIDISFAGIVTNIADV